MEQCQAYVGETSRSIKERAAEHWQAYRSKTEDSHILKHHEIHHRGEGEPDFIMKVVGVHRTALSRQVGEAVRFVKRGLVLNSRSEFNRCSISRLSLEQVITPDIDPEVPLAEERVEEDLTTDWTEQLLVNRDRADQQNRQVLGRVETAGSYKRKEGDIDIMSSKKKKRKYALAGEEWGEQELKLSSFLYSGIENMVPAEQNLELRVAHQSNQKKRAEANLKKITGWVTISATSGGEGSSKNIHENDHGPPLATADQSKKVCEEFEECTSMTTSMKSMNSMKCENTGKENSEMPTTKKKKKVWVKLKNGLFGWRVVSTPLRKIDKTDKGSFSECGNSTSKSKFTPAIGELGNKVGIPKSGEISIKRKYFGGNTDRAGDERERLASKMKR